MRMVYSLFKRGDPHRNQTMFNEISKPEFNETLGFGTVLEERREHSANWGPFHLETVTRRQAATGIANTWTKFVSSHQEVRDLQTMTLQVSGTGQECADWVVANMARFK